MSAIAKPHLFFAGATGTQVDTVIPVDWIYTMEKINVAKSATDSTLQYYIYVHLVPATSGNIRIEKILFDTLAHRDASFTNAKTLIAASVANS